MDAEKVMPIRQSETRKVKGPDPGEWFQMAHKLTEALYSTKELDKAQIKLLLYIVHMTWGSMGRKSFVFSTSAAVKAVGLDKAQLLRAKNVLIQANLILKTDKDGHELTVNKYPDTWDIHILRGKREADTERRRSSSRGGDGSTPPTRGDGSTPGGVTDPHHRGDGSTPLTTLNGAVSPDPGDPIDIVTDIEIDNPPNPPRGERWGPLYRFEDWYGLYPKKKNRGDAERAWKKLVKSKDFGDEFVDLLIEATQRQAASDPSWLKSKGQFIPYPASWLNAKGWENETDDLETDDFWSAARFKRGSQ